MSDKKTPAGTPSTGIPPTDAAFDQEFDKFLSEETARIDAIYRKLPQAEPDAQLDARVRAHARGGVRDEPTFAPARRTEPVSRSRSWLPAFASAAVLVLAAGIAWRLGPQNWAEKDVAKSVAVDATTASDAGASTTGASLPSLASTTAQRTPATNAPGEAEAAKPGGIAQPNPDDGANAPVPFPPAKPAPRISPPPAVSGGALTGASQAELRKTEAARADAAASRAPEPSAPTREKSATANLDVVRGELKKSQAPVPPATTADVSGASAARAVSNAPVPATVSGVGAKSSIATTVPEATTTRELTTPAPEQAPADARRRDETMTGLPQQSASGIADRSKLAETKALSTAAPRPAAAPPPPPPPPIQAPAPVSGFASEPATAATAPTSRQPASAAAGVDEETQKQAYADHLAVPPGSPQPNVPGRPTAAQLAAWPAPNCRAAGTVSASGPNINTRTWNYPPDVPDSARLRLVIVKEYLDLDSREGALKAYADFRHCYPDDRWPASLLRRLGTQ